MDVEDGGRVLRELPEDEDRRIAPRVALAPLEPLERPLHLALDDVGRKGAAGAHEVPHGVARELDGGQVRRRLEHVPQVACKPRDL